MFASISGSLCAEKPTCDAPFVQGPPERPGSRHAGLLGGRELPCEGDVVEHEPIELVVLKPKIDVTPRRLGDCFEGILKCVRRSDGVVERVKSVECDLLQELLLVAKVEIDRAWGVPELLGERAHRDPSRAMPVHDSDRLLEDLCAKGFAGRRHWYPRGTRSKADRTLSLAEQSGQSSRRREARGGAPGRGPQARKDAT